MPYGQIKVDEITFTNAGVDQTISVSGVVASISGNITATGTISGDVIRGGTLVSGATVTGTAGQFGTITGNTAAFTTVTGTTVTGTTATFTSGVFTNISGGTHTVTSGVFASGTAANPSITFQGDLNTGIYSPGADQVAVATNGTARVTIDGSGRLLVGTSSGNLDFQLKTSGGLQAVNTSELALRYNMYNDSGDKYIQAANKASSLVMNGNGEFSFYNTNTASTSSGSSVTGLTERTRIRANGQFDVFDSSGNGIVSRSASAAGTTDGIFVGTSSATNVTNGNVVFIVRTNGNVVNTNNSYGAISDLKLKENIVDAGSQWDDLKALQVRKYNFKEGQTHTQIGLVAQEAELVSPGLVSESPDRDADGNDLGTVTKSVNYSVLYMKAVKALQEAMERIEQLEAKVAALESA